MTDTNSGWDGRGAGGTGGTRASGAIPGPGPDTAAERCAGGKPRGRRVAAASLVALAALATGCEPGTAEGAQDVPPVRATQAAAPTPSPFLTAPAPSAEDAKPSTAPPPSPSASTPAPAPTTARPPRSRAPHRRRAS